MTIRDGDNFDAAEVNEEFDDIVTRANTRDLTDVRPRAFQRRHLVSLLASETTTVASDMHETAVAGPTATFSGASPSYAGGPGYEQYPNRLDPDPGGPKNFQSFNGSGPVAGVGWNVVSRGGADDLRVRFQPGTTLAAKERGIWVSASIAIGNQDPGQNITDLEHGFSLALGIRTQGGALYCIERSARHHIAMAVVRQRLTICTFILAGDITNAGGDIRDVVVLFGRWHISTTLPEPTIDNDGWVELGPGTITALPMRAGAL